MQVSVIMSVHNDSDFVQDAIDSILNQTFTDFEFIIIDDASTDDTPEILNRNDDPRIVRLQNETNLKLAASLNRGLAMAQGDLIARMDGDDVSMPDRLEKQIAFMADHPEIAILGTNYHVINQNSDVMGRSDQPLSHGLIAWHYLSRFAYPLTHATIMARREVLVNTGGYNVDFPREQDGELFLRLIHTTKYANLPEYLYSVRMTRDSKSADNTFSVSFPITIELRRQCLSTILERDITTEVISGLIFPRKRKRRQGVEVDLETSKQSVTLLIELSDALAKKGYMEPAEYKQARSELADLSVNILSRSEEFLVEISRKIEINVLSQLLFNRLEGYLSHPRETIELIRKRLFQR